MHIHTHVGLCCSSYKCQALCIHLIDALKFSLSHNLKVVSDKNTVYCKRRLVLLLSLGLSLQYQQDMPFNVFSYVFAK